MNRVVKVADIATLNGETFRKYEYPENIKYLDTGNLTKNKIEEFQYLNTKVDKIPSRAQRKVKKYTILYSTVRPNQEHYGFFEDDEKDIVASTGFTTIDVNVDFVYPKFLYFLLIQKHIVNYLHSLGMNAVSSYPSISPNDIGNLKFEFPDLPTQKAIAKVLSDLDAKIELNNKINRELEAMAKTLYDYWFVQFEFPSLASAKDESPSVASAKDRFPANLGGGILSVAEGYKSLGGKMVYNGELKREIPEGWEIKELSEISNITMGQSPSGSSYNEDKYGEIFFQGSTDFGWRYPTIRQYTSEPIRMAKNGDILLSVRAPVGALNIADNNCCIGRGLAALNSKDNANSYLFYVMLYFKQIFDHRNNSGTTFGSITKDDLFSLKVIYPKNELLKKYDNVVSKYNETILNNHKQNQQLTALRDWLLPMLMNGQITVGEAEEKLNMAAEPEERYNAKKTNY